MSGSVELGPFYAHPFLLLKACLIGIIKDRVIRLSMSGILGMLMSPGIGRNNLLFLYFKYSYIKFIPAFSADLSTNYQVKVASLDYVQAQNSY